MEILDQKQSHASAKEHLVSRKEGKNSHTIPMLWYVYFIIMAVPKITTFSYIYIFTIFLVARL